MYVAHIKKVHLLLLYIYIYINYTPTLTTCKIFLKKTVEKFLDFKKIDIIFLSPIIYKLIKILI